MQSIIRINPIASKILKYRRGEAQMHLLVHGSIRIFVAALAMTTAAHSGARAAEGYWVCNAYGFRMSPTRWHMVSGSPAATKPDAIRNAAEECRRRGLNVCSKSGCTNHSRN